MKPERMTPLQVTEAAERIAEDSLVTIVFTDESSESPAFKLRERMDFGEIAFNGELRSLLNQVVAKGWDEACPDRTISFIGGKVALDQLQFFFHVLGSVYSIEVQDPQ